MRGLILYFSNTGNTKLACEHINKKTQNIQFELLSMTDQNRPNLENYDFVGLACFTMFWLPPYFVQDYLQKLKTPKNKPAFVFNTYGLASVRTLPNLARLATRHGFKVVAGHSLHCPESFPPLITKNINQEQAPSSKELTRFNKFIAELDMIALKISRGETVAEKSIKLNWFNPLTWIPERTRENIRRQMGEKFVDEKLCRQCGLCQRLCPKKAITLNPYPIFEIEKCDGCWRCFNRCPQKAIYTKKYRGTGHYPTSSKILRQKLKY